ncbi:unnamed protein product [Pieris macdunnoughi]|uniref:Major facilitator superfamily (MFS) profile domain-containing protein n=1 Tax=Pieris macdunnoughi TaxID=345717 RepID=A0A821V9C9_9NEOP|nr:unnamed protein product [Pieris macdunnoughi]
MSSNGKGSPFLKQCFVTAAICCNIIGQGAAFGYLAVQLPTLKSKDTEIPLSKTEEAWIAGMLPLFMIPGFFFATPLMDRYGRKATHVILIMPALVGWFMLTIASSVAEIIIARALQGISGGMLNTLRSVLIGEYTSPKNRGAFLTTISFSQAFGIFFVHLIGSCFSWQMTAFISVFFPFVSLLMTIYAPESPSWLLTRGRIDECKEVFRWLRGNEEDEELEDMIQARLAFEKYEATTNHNRNKIVDIIRTIKKKEFYKPIILMAHLNIITQFSGGTTMAVFAPSIIGKLIPQGDVAFWMVFLDTQRLISNFLAVYIMNKVKRRTMMFSTAGLCVISHIAIATYVLCRLMGWNYSSVWLPALLINIQYFTVAVGMVPLPNIIGGEVFPLQYRSIGGSISLATGGMFTFVVLLTFLQLMDNLGLHGTYYLYSVILIVNVFIVWLLLPETRGKTLQQIEDEFRGKPLRLDEIEARLSLQSNPIEIYKRRVSEQIFSSTLTL